MSRMLAAVVTLLILAPVAGAAPTRLRSVGELLVDASGHASGLNLVADIQEADGVVSSYNARGAAVFEQVSIDGFRAVGKLQGVGSARVLLQGSNAILSIHDDSLAALKIEATQAAVVRYRLAEGIEASTVDGSDAIVNLRASDGASVGSIVIVGADGAQAKGERVHVALRNIEARLREGSQVVFVAAPAQAAAEAHHDVLVRALAEGRVATTYATEVEGSAVTSSRVDYAPFPPTLSTEATGEIRAVLDAASPGGILALDLAYETLPARAEGDVAAYVDGKLLPPAASAADAHAAAARGFAAYHATVVDGRTHILAALPRGEHQITFSSVSAPTEAQARAEGRAASDSRVSGAFSGSSDGKVLGDFVTGFLPREGLAIEDYTTLSGRVEVFRSIRAADASGAVRALEGASVVLDGDAARLTLLDDAYGTVLFDAKERTAATYELAKGIVARPQTSDVVRLTGPDGDVGTLAIVERVGGQDAATSLSATGQGSIHATLDEGSRVVYRGASEPFPTDEPLALAIARGDVGAQLLAGARDDALVASSVSYVQGVDAAVTAEARRIVVEYDAPADVGESFVLDARRGSALAARSGEDVRVLVDGRSALAVSTVEAALAHGKDARWFAETNAVGSLRLVVNAAGGSAVTIESTLGETARAVGDGDAFGAFRVFEDGRVVGSFVTLQSDRATGVVSKITHVSTGREVFASLVAGRSGFVSTGVDGAANVVLENREARIEAADTTTGSLKVVAKESTDAILQLASGLRYQPRTERVVEVRTLAGEHFGTLVLSGEGRGALDAGDAGDGAVRAQIDRGQQLIFRAHAGIDSELSQAQRTMVSDAIANGVIAGTVVVQTSDALERQSLGERVTTAVASSYGDVKIVTAATRERVDVTVSSATHLGKTLLITLDPSTVPSLAKGDAHILFDGAAAQHAESYADVLDPLDDGDAGEYFVLAGESGTQVLVSIPDFSVHTVTLEERPADGGTSPWVHATIGLALLLATQTALVILRRKNTKHDPLTGERNP